MVQKASVVTAERFDGGLRYSEYIDQIKVNKDRFQEHYESTPLSESDVVFFQKAAKNTEYILTNLMRLLRQKI